MREIKAVQRGAVLLSIIFALSAGAIETGYGISADHLGDAGIGSDARVVFSENFEEGSLAAVVVRWDEASNQSIMSLASDTPARPQPTVP